MNLLPTFEHYYPEGSVGGQCGDFAHKLVQFPSVGDTLASKTAAVKKYGILAKDLHGEFREGDVVITSEAKNTGHVFVVNHCPGPVLQASESNYYLDKRVHHTRLIRKDSPKIVGVIRGPLKVPIINPAPMFPLKPRITIIVNGQNWPSIESKCQEVRDWYVQHSGGKLEPIFSIRYANLSNIEWRVLPDGSALIHEPWFDANVLDGSAHSTMFIVRDEDVPDYFPGGVKLLGRTSGFMGKVPTKTVIGVGENEMSLIYPAVGGFFDYVRHELMHSCYLWSGSFIHHAPPRNDEYFGYDYTHKYFNLPNSVIEPGLGNPEGAFSQLNYENINQSLKDQTMAKKYKVNDHGKLGILVSEGFTGAIMYAKDQAAYNDLLKDFEVPGDAPTINLP